MTEFEVYRKSALRDVLAYPSISDEHRHELESGDEQWEMTIATCYKQNVKPSVCALALYWQDQYNKWGQPDLGSAGPRKAWIHFPGVSR